MLPDNFDALYAALGIKRKDWTKPAPQQAATTRAKLPTHYQTASSGFYDDKRG